MGKWNKDPPEVSEEFLQNEQRRKQMIIEAAKRRKQKEKKLQQQVQIQKKNDQQALLRHKQQKKDAYVKYLRNNMHDKYEQMKRNQKLNQPQVRTKSKWKKETIDCHSQLNSQVNHIRPEHNLQGLDLQVNIPSNNKISNNKIVNNKVGGQVVRNVPESRYQRDELPSTRSNNMNNNLDSKEEKQGIKYPVKNQSQKRRLLQDEFENMWKQQHQQPEDKQIDYDMSLEETVFDQMMGSKLLDSLDLDLDTVSRGKRLDKQIKEEKKKNLPKHQNKQIDQIKNMIGYESVLMSIDQRSQMIQKYNQFMKNQLNQPQALKKLEAPSSKTFSKEKDSKNAKNTGKSTKPENFQKLTKNLNQGQVFNQLKNKKQGKILNWAQQQAQQADDLFSNCSTNKKSKTRGFELLKQINKEIQQKGKKPPIPSQNQNTLLQQANMKKKQKPLETIPEKKINSSLQKLRQRSFDKKSNMNQTPSTNLVPSHNTQNRSYQIRRSVSKQKVTEVNKPQQRMNRINSAENRNGQPPQPPRNNSKQRVNKTATNSFKQTNDVSARVNNMTQPRNGNENRKLLSKEKEGNKSEKQIPSYGQGYTRNPPPKVQQTVRSAHQVPASHTAKKLLHLPPCYQRPSNTYDQITIATQDQVFQVQSFIKNQLVSLNRQQRQLQEQLKNIHIQSKQKIKQVEKKYDIKTDYRHSFQLKQKDQCFPEDDEHKSHNSYRQAHNKQTEDQLQESIQRLDDMLLRKQIVNKEKNSRITEQDNESQSTHRSLINPMTDPITLHKQVLQLAQNLSRFQGEPQDPTIGYGAKLRMKKKSIEKENKVQHRREQSTKKKRQTEIQLSESQDVNFSQLNFLQEKSKVSKNSKVSKPPQLQYSQHHGSANIPPGYNQSGLLDEDDDNNDLEDSIQKGKIEVNERLKRMLLE